MNFLKRLFSKKKTLTLEEYVALRKQQDASSETITQEVMESFSQTFLGKPYQKGVSSEEHYDESLYRWACAGVLNACARCQARQGKAHTWEEWEKLGMPRSKVVCGGDCRCMLVPASCRVETLQEAHERARNYEIERHKSIIDKNKKVLYCSKYVKTKLSRCNLIIEHSNKILELDSNQHEIEKDKLGIEKLRDKLLTLMSQGKRICPDDYMNN